MTGRDAALRDHGLNRQSVHARDSGEIDSGDADLLPGKVEVGMILVATITHGSRRHEVVSRQSVHHSLDDTVALGDAFANKIVGLQSLGEHEHVLFAVVPTESSSD